MLYYVESYTIETKHNLEKDKTPLKFFHLDDTTVTKETPAKFFHVEDTSVADAKEKNAVFFHVEDSSEL